MGYSVQPSISRSLSSSAMADANRKRGAAATLEIVGEIVGGAPFSDNQRRHRVASLGAAVINRQPRQQIERIGELEVLLAEAVIEWRHWALLS